MRTRSRRASASDGTKDLQQGPRRISIGSSVRWSSRSMYCRN